MFVLNKVQVVPYRTCKTFWASYVKMQQHMEHAVTNVYYLISFYGWYLAIRSYAGQICHFQEMAEIKCNIKSITTINHDYYYFTSHSCAYTYTPTCLQTLYNLPGYSLLPSTITLGQTAALLHWNWLRCLGNNISKRLAVNNSKLASLTLCMGCIKRHWCN